MYRFARRVLFLLMLGAFLTALSAWAIHGVHFWRARTSIPKLVHSANNYSYVKLPAIWGSDGEFARQIGVDHTDEEYDWKRAHRQSQRPLTNALAITGSHVWPVARIDPDLAWQVHRRVEPGMLPSPDCPAEFPFGYGLYARDRFGWNPGESYVFIVGEDPYANEPFQTSGETLTVFNTGWPWRSMQTGVHHITDSQQRTTTPPVSLTGGLTLWTNGGQDHLDRFTLPLFPLWPGFALNTLVFATGLALIWYTPPSIRHVRRKRSGRCVKCGYDITGLTTCPECGHGAQGPEPNRIP